MNTIKYSRRTRDIFGKGLLCLCFKRLEIDGKKLQRNPFEKYDVLLICNMYYRYWHDLFWEILERP